MIRGKAFVKFFDFHKISSLSYFVERQTPGNGFCAHCIVNIQPFLLGLNGLHVVNLPERLAVGLLVQIVLVQGIGLLDDLLRLLAADLDGGVQHLALEARFQTRACAGDRAGRGARALQACETGLGRHQAGRDDLVQEGLGRQTADHGVGQAGHDMGVARNRLERHAGHLQQLLGGRAEQVRVGRGGADRGAHEDDAQRDHLCGEQHDLGVQTAAQAAVDRVGIGHDLMVEHDALGDLVHDRVVELELGDDADRVAVGLFHQMGGGQLADVADADADAVVRHARAAGHGCDMAEQLHLFIRRKDLERGAGAQLDAVDGGQIGGRTVEIHARLLHVGEHDRDKVLIRAGDVDRAAEVDRGTGVVRRAGVLVYGVVALAEYGVVGRHADGLTDLILGVLHDAAGVLAVYAGLGQELDRGVPNAVRQLVVEVDDALGLDLDVVLLDDLLEVLIDVLHVEVLLADDRTLDAASNNVKNFRLLIHTAIPPVIP